MYFSLNLNTKLIQQKGKSAVLPLSFNINLCSRQILRLIKRRVNYKKSLLIDALPYIDIKYTSLASM